ncbi:MAG: hypothetical protein KatS3mg003_1193 [Candidatus Nitrosocaldaceae archaeon]|nr:MAG: hypothetical protein KatS3mg003_1193 [Candidatus Nitrosocaldaceae archaeon]
MIYMDPLDLSKLKNNSDVVDIKEARRSKEHDLLDKINNLEKENRLLKSRLAKLEYRGSLPLSIILLSIGGLLLLFSYAYESLILTFIGLGLVVWGSILFYSLPKRFVDEKSLVESISIIKSLSYAINAMGYKGKAIFFYPNTLSGLANGYMFIPSDHNVMPDITILNEESKIDDGLLIPAHAQSIVKLLEEEFNTNLLMLELAELQNRVEQFFVEELRIIDSIRFSIKEDIITVVIEGNTIVDICKHIKSFDINNIGCPLCASLALMISKVTGIPVTIEDTNVGLEKVKIVYRLLENGV